ncbi:hypothetical protein ACIF8W_35230 [Streptomyces sp. NPDC085639]
MCVARVRRARDLPVAALPLLLGCAPAGGGRRAAGGRATAAPRPPPPGP